MENFFITDLEECGKLWETLIRPQTISDEWEFRLCFHRHFNHKPCFLLFKDQDGIAGLVPLSYNTKREQYVFFPGEVWNGKTWLERTPVFVRRPEMFKYIFSNCPKGSYLRYIQPPQSSGAHELEIDETGYCLYPPRLGYDIQSYFDRFSNKKRKAIMKTIQLLIGSSSRYHLNRLEDFEALVEMNIQSFGSNSYLYDQRFKNAFRDVMHLLHAKGMLRLVSLEINGKLAAIDLGALYKDTYTVFLGGTRTDMPGVAKVINLNHIEFAFSHKISKLDFLCGDFKWKTLWHLDPEPLYLFKAPKTHSHCTADLPHIPIPALREYAETVNLHAPEAHFSNRVSNV